MAKKEPLEFFYPHNLNLFVADINESYEFVKRQLMRDHYLDYFQDLKNTFNKINLNIFNKINEILFEAFQKEKQIFTMGNGGSGATASHFVCDLNKGVNSSKAGKFKAICLIDNLPILLAYANDVSYSDVFYEQLKNFMQREDIVIGFSGSGNSENIIKAIEYANENDGITIGFSGFDGGKLSQISQISLVVPVNDMQKCEDIHLILSHLIMRTMNYLIKIDLNG